ncbi:carbonic anhydrase [Dehalobacterium formicoaceticum]|uniref:beta-class carbonic anhydrase n=1 Tax=Dehalobacterium formicoaceticum TaxID=51515 RepID=UPI0031F6E4F0
MSYIDEILAFNKEFVESKQYETLATTKFPNKKIAVLSCMDTRLTELLPAALNFKNGDIKIIKNAGAMISHPFGSVMRSLLVAIYELGVQEIMVIGHYDCGMQGLGASKLIEKMKKRNISPDKIDMVQYAGIDLHKWLKGFDDAEASVQETVHIIRKHPFIPADVGVYGFMMDPVTGRLAKLAPEVERME